MSLNGLNPLRKGGEAMCNGRLIYLQTLSGYRGPRESDHRGLQYTLPFDIEDQMLGQALLEVVAKSRFVLPRKRTDVVQHPDVEFDEEMFDPKIREARYKAWVQKTIEQFGYKSEREIFKRMMLCSIQIECGVITFSPTRHHSLLGWSREENDGLEEVTLADTSSPKEVGAALRLAFSRCVGK